MMLSSRFSRACHPNARRLVSTLQSNSHIYVHPNPETSTYTLSLLPSPPRSSKTIVGVTSSNPPTPRTFRENREFNIVLHAVIQKYATQDPSLQAQAAAFASPGGFGLGSGSSGFPQNHPSQSSKRRSGAKAGGDGGGGASAQGGMGGGGVGGWIHVSDLRNPPDYGRIAWPEDIFGSVEVDGNGKFVENGNYQESGTYRVCTNEGILGLTPYLREKLVEKLKQIEAQSDR